MKYICGKCGKYQYLSDKFTYEDPRSKCCDYLLFEATKSNVRGIKNKIDIDDGIKDATDFLKNKNAQK